jgi:gas vesicle protein
MKFVKTLASTAVILSSTTAHASAHWVESVAVGTVTVLTSVATLALMESHPWGFDEELKLTLIPFIGSTVVVLSAFYLNPEVETRRIVCGRSLIALFVGSISPQVIAIIFPTTASFIAHPIISLGLGGVCGAIAYILSRPLFAGMYKRSKETASKILDKAEAVAKAYTMEAVKQQFEEAAPERKRNVMEAVEEQIVKDLPLQHATVKDAVKEAIKEEHV